MRRTRRRRRLAPFLRLMRRVVAGVMPAEDGGPPLAMRHAATRLLWLVAAGIGLALGGVVGLLVVLAQSALPNAPLLLLGLVVGIVLGAVATVLTLAWLRRVRIRAGKAYPLLPTLVLGATLLLLALGAGALRALGKSSPP